MPVERARPRLYLVDGSALAYRSFYALGRTQLTTGAGEPTGAVLGFANTIWGMIRDESPEYLAIVFDSPAPTFRHRTYEAYKATRQKMPDELKSQIPRLREFVEAYPLVLIVEEGVEADDIMGSYAVQLAGPDLEVVLVSGDKDFCQLVNENVTIFNPGRGGASRVEAHRLDPGGVVEKFGVPPSLIADLLALMGDTSDNVPGVPGIGEKTASLLIQRFGSLEALYRDLSGVDRKAVREKLEAHRDQAFLSRELVTIRTDCPLPHTLEDLKLGPPSPRLVEFFRELEFTRLRREAEELIGGSRGASPPGNAGPEKRTVPDSAGPEKSGPRDPGTGGNLSLFDLPGDVSTPLPESQPDNFRIVHREEDLAEVASAVRKAEGVALAAHLDGPDPMRACVAGLALAWNAEPPVFVPLAPANGPGADADIPPAGPEGSTPTWSADPEAVQRTLSPVLADPGVPKWGHDLKPILIALGRSGFPVQGVAFDARLASYLIDAEARHDLGSLARRELGEIREIEPDDAPRECARRVRVVASIRWGLVEDLEVKGLISLFNDVEMPLLLVLREMEETGVAIDADFLAGMSGRLKGETDVLEEKALEAAGETFNLNSPPQLGKILFEKLKLPVQRKTKTGYSTDSDVLEDLAAFHALPRLVLEYRQLSKLKSTYVDALPRLIHPRTGRVHTSFNQTVAATGRLSSSNPNLQNIPIRTPLGREVRRAFVAGAPHLRLISADYSQVELRIMAHLSRDERLLESFRKDVDVHRETAAALFGVAPEAVTPEQRGQAKTANFAIMYGQGAVGLARQIGMTKDEAARFIARYRGQFPGVNAYLERCIDEGRRTGFVTTLLNRRRYLPNLHSPNGRLRAEAERMAVNTPLQGTAADLIKTAMIAVHRDLSRHHPEARLLLQVHDELLLESPAAEASEVASRVKEAMEGAIRLDVPVKVDVGLGTDWAGIH